MKELRMSRFDNLADKRLDIVNFSNPERGLKTTQVANIFNVSVRTVQSVVKNFKENGYASLHSVAISEIVLDKHRTHYTRENYVG